MTRAAFAGAAIAALLPNAAGTTVLADPVGPVPFSQGSVCLETTAPDLLNTLFDAAPGNVIGADYQQVTPLPDGRVLWMFQDALVRLPGGGDRTVHNMAMIQDDKCFDVRYGGTKDDPNSFIISNGTVNYGH